MDKQRRSLFFGKSASLYDDVRPPWLTSIDTFLDDCTQCNKCVQACPENIIQKSEGGYPAVNFALGECTFCHECATACPEALFSLDKTSSPWSLSAEVNARCLTYFQITCQSCRDSCDYGALTFTPQLNKVSQPQIDASRCTGCGACVSPCANNAIKMSFTKSSSSSINKDNDHVQ